MVTMALGKLVLDMKLYPRGRLDVPYISDMCESLRAGTTFPPIVIDKKSRRITDGAHRWRMYGRVYDAAHEVEVVEKSYRNEREMLLDAARLNAAHGQKLNSFDRTRCLLLAEELGIETDAIASALGITLDYASGLLVRKTSAATNGVGTRTPLKSTIRHMAGKKLTKRQHEANKKLGGMNQSFYVNQVIELLESNLIDRENEMLMGRLEVLKGLLSKFK